MDTIKMPDAKREKTLFWTIFAAVMFAMLMLIAGQDFYVMRLVMRRYIPMLVWGIMGVALYRGDYGRRGVYIFALGFLGWYVLTRLIQGDLYLVTSFNGLNEMCLVYGLAFPAAKLMKDGGARRAFDLLALVYVLIFGLAAVFGLICCVLGINIAIPNSEIFLIVMSRGSINLLGMTQNPAAGALTLAFFLAIYLYAQHPKKLWIAPLVIFLVSFYVALALTNSLTAIIALSLSGAAIVCIVLARALRGRLKKLLAPVLVLVYVLGVLVLYKGSSLSYYAVVGLGERVQHASAAEVMGEKTDSGDVAVVPQTEGGLDLSMSGRTDIYRVALTSLLQTPTALLIGTPDNDVVHLLGEFEGNAHMHNSFLQTLCLTGVPGLLAVIWLTICIVWAGLRLLLSRRATAAEKILPFVVLPLFLHGMLESFLFVPWDNLTFASLFNFMFALCSGYVIETWVSVKNLPEPKA